MNKYELLNQKKRNSEVKKRVAAYCRVSTDSRDQANSFESQCRFFRQYIDDNDGWKLYRIFADEGISGDQYKET